MEVLLEETQVPSHPCSTSGQWKLDVKVVQANKQKQYRGDERFLKRFKRPGILTCEILVAALALQIPEPGLGRYRLVGKPLPARLQSFYDSVFHSHVREDEAPALPKRGLECHGHNSVIPSSFCV